MGNRVYLSLCTQAQAAEGSGRPFAEAKNHFPTLWQLLLADGSEGPANTDQRLSFLDAGTGNLLGDADAARARFIAVQAYVVGHRQLDRIAGLGRQFEAFLAYLDEESAQVRASAEDEDDASAPLLFSANLDELSWLDGGIEDYTQRMAEQCSQFWEELRQAIHADRPQRVAELLEVVGPAWQADEWASWLWQFGFGGLDHPYFEDRERPRGIDFAAFVRDADQDGRELDWQRRVFEDGGLYGVRRRGAYDEHDCWQPGRVLVPAQWEDVHEAAHPRRELYWVQRGQRYGLLERHRDGSLAVLLEPVLDEISDFQHLRPQALATVAIDGQAGWLQDDGAWRLRPGALSPAPSGIGELEHGRAWAEADGRVGYLDATGAWRVAPVYEEGSAFQPGGCAMVRQGEAWGLVDGDGRAVTALEYPHLDWDEFAQAYRFRSQGRAGWLRPDGSAWIAPEWDEILALAQGQAIRVRRKGRYGLLDWNGRPLIPVEYRELESAEDCGLMEAEPRRFVVVAAGRNGGTGLFDASGRELIPPVYDGLGLFAYRFELDEQGQERWDYPRQQVLLWREQDGRRRHGAWDLDLGRETVPCAHDRVFAVVLYRDGAREVAGYLTGDDLDPAQAVVEDEQAVRVLDAEGAPIHGEGYAWLAERRSLGPETLTEIGQSLHRAWSAGEPVEAVANAGPYCWLHRDGRVQAHADWLAGRYAAGDRAAALRLARDLREGAGIDLDLEASRLWTARAAGIEPPAAARPRGLLGRLLGGLSSASEQAHWSPRGAAEGGEPDAMDELAGMLAEGAGGPEWPALAREWLEHLLARVDPRHVRAHTRLGHLLQYGIGGAADTARALALFAHAAEHDDADALYNLGYAHEFGVGTGADAGRALPYYRRAADLGDGNAAHRAGLAALQCAAEADDADQREALQAEAAQWLQQAWENYDYVGRSIAGSELGALLYRGQGVACDRERAEALWLAAAEHGHGPSIEQLIALYGDADSERYDPAQAEHWRQQR